LRKATRIARARAKSSLAIAREVQGYIDRVISGEAVVGKWVRLAVERHVRDLTEGPGRGLYFDPEAGARVIRFFGLLTHSKGEWAGQPFVLAPWQMFLLWCVFGWKRESDHTRRFRTVYCEICRKGGKTTLAAGIGLYMLLADGEEGAEIYTAATKRDQARLAHEEAVRMVKKSRSLRKAVRVSKDNLCVESTNSKYVPLGGDADSTDGLSPSCCIIDELHAHPNRAMYDVLDTATGARRQPLIFCITTAGHDRLSICWEQHAYSQRVLEGIVDEDSHFGFVASIDEEDDWRDEGCWAKANPNLGVSMKLDDLRRKAAKAKEMPTALNAFLRLHLGVWTEAETRWLPLEKWEGSKIDIREEDLLGRTCWAGLDLGSTQDLTAMVLVFPDEDEHGGATVLPYFWAPEMNAAKRERNDHAPYLTWSRQGYLELTEGEVTDYNFILDRIAQLREKFDIREIAFDRFGAASIVTALQEQGAQVVQFGQGYVSMSPACKEVERLVVSSRLRHPGNPVLTWCAANAVVEMDAAGNLKVSRRKCSEKIDGIVALAMAVGRWMAQPAEAEFDFRII
jgi:phage terminase large subunit-like protein